jgi:hypothetical protein
LKSNGTVVAWGDMVGVSSGATDVPAGLSGVVAVSAGSDFSLALKANGTVVAWGQDEDGDTDVPSGLTGVVAIAAAEQGAFALKSNGTVVAWGRHDFGQADIPAGLTGVIAIAAGQNHGLALKSNGTVVAWGDDYYGQTDVPAGLAGVTAIAAGIFHSVALKSDGSVVAWGLGNQGETSIPAGLAGAFAIAAGGGTSLALVPAAPVLAVSGMTTPRVADSTGSLRVTAIDANGKRVYGYRGTVRFTSSDAAASLPANYTFTAADNGTHVFVANVILRTAGTQSVRATDAAMSYTTGVESGIVVTPRVVTSLVTSGMTTPRIAGSTGSIRVTALDAAGKRVYSYLGTIHFTSTDPQAILPADYTFTTADNGTHVFVAKVTLQTPGTWPVTATDTAHPSLSGTQSGIVVNARPLLVSGMTTPRKAGTTGSITVTAVDTGGNRNPAYLGTIHFTSSDPQANLPADYTFTAADAGLHAFAGVILKTAGTQSVTAADTANNAIKGSQIGVVVTAAALVALRVSGMTTPRTAGSIGAIRVTAIDAFGNRAYPGNGVPAYLGTINFTSSDMKAGLPADYTFTAADAGTHVFSVTLRTEGIQSVTATDTATRSITGVQTGILVT